DFRGQRGETFETLSLGRVPATRIMLVGLGERAAADAGAIRQATMMAARQLSTAATIVTTLPAATTGGTGTAAGAGSAAEAESLTAAASAFAEGLLLGTYRF